MTFDALVKRFAMLNSISLANSEGTIKAVFNLVTAHAFEGDDVVIPGFGRFVVKSTKEHKMKIGGVEKTVKASDRLTFRPFASTKRAVSGTH